MRRRMARTVFRPSPPGPDVAAVPDYTWTANRRYRGADGRFVSRASVRGALDAYLEGLAGEMRELTAAAFRGELELPAWQARMQALVKDGHSAAAAVGSGGRGQVGRDGWLLVARRVKSGYGDLRELAAGLADGSLSPGQVSGRVLRLAIKPTATYEEVLRLGDLASGLVDEERRLLHSSRSCPSCTRYEAMGWQPAGVLPGIGVDCECGDFCRCSFERWKAPGRRVGP